MIISHKYGFIFIKTEKTAGTSIEIALSKYCEDDDVITPIGPDSEKIRKKLGYRGPQNYHIPFRMYSVRDWIAYGFRRKRVSFFNHAGARFIQRHIPVEVWGSHFKFCFERNPWDKVVSWYYFQHPSGPRPSISSFIQSGGADTIRGFDLYAIYGQIVVDKVFFFEQLDQDLEEVGRLLGLPGPIQLPRAKTDHRSDRRPYRDILSEQDRARICRVYSREIEAFGYEY